MKSRRLSSWGVILALCLTLSHPVIAQDLDTAPTTRPAEPSSVQAIAQAADPSSAVAAYAKALSAEPDNRNVIDSAYVRRMVDLGVPEMAEAQAQDLVLRDPENALAWAVLAHCTAKREQTAAAFGQIQTAAQRDPSHPFVQRTAGQLLAWYDSRPQPPEMPESIAAQIPALRFKVENQLAYKQAYNLARAEYESEFAEVPPATAPIRVSRPATDDVPQVIDSPYVAGTGSGPIIYEPYPVYYPTYYPAYDYDYYRPWWYGSSVIIVGSFTHHNHKHHSHCLVPSHRGFSKHGFSGSGGHGRFASRDGRGHSPNAGPINSRGFSSARFHGPMPASNGRGSAPVSVNGRGSGPRVFTGPMPAANRRDSAPAAVNRRGSGPQVFTGPVQRPAARAAAASPARASAAPPSRGRTTFVGPVQNPSRSSPAGRVSGGGGPRGGDRSAGRSGGGRSSGGRGGGGRGGGGRGR